jgi:hypothetical protein
MLVAWLVAALIPGEPWGGEVANTSPEPSATPADMVLTVHEGVLSLRAQEASLKGLFEAIGRQLSIEVVARIPAEERITIAFDRLSLAEALKRLLPYVNYLVLEDAARAQGTIQTLIVVSKQGHGVRASGPREESAGPTSPEHRPTATPATDAPARPAPFTFEFDPSAVGVRGR